MRYVLALCAAGMLSFGLEHAANRNEQAGRNKLKEISGRQMFSINANDPRHPGRDVLTVGATDPVAFAAHARRGRIEAESQITHAGYLRR